MVLQQGDRLGNYVIDSRVGKGRTGSVYLGKIADRLNLEAAIKYPSSGREINTLKALHGCLGVPQVYASGLQEEDFWVAMELLGPTLIVMFRTLWLCTRNEQRWLGICIIGRLLLRRILAIHKRGFLHGDIKPDNVVLGRRKGCHVEVSWPFLVDFGLARELTDDTPVEGHVGTIEFSSINSMDGGPRVAHDDIEALGWMLLYGMVGDLPWFECIHDVDWSDKPARAALVQCVQKAKLDLLGEGPDSLECRYPGLPPEMCEFLRLCRRSAGERASNVHGAKRDYDTFARLLGCWGIDGEDDDFDDLVHFHKFFEGGTSALPEPPAMQDTYFVVANWNRWTFEEMSRHHFMPDTFLLEVHLPQDDCEFQIIRNRDWSQVFHPPSKQAGLNVTSVLGPDKKCHGLNWLIGSKAGAVMEIEFQHAPDHKVGLSKIHWKELRHEPLSLQSPQTWYTKYFLVGTWDHWVGKRELTWNGKSFSICVQLGHKLLESFQILEDGKWDRKLHPSVKRANPHIPHQLMGPEKNGHGRNWTIGAHPEDKAMFGAQYVVRLLVDERGLKGVDWVRLS
mmetsp:Transcript_81928/g.227150  ORF Transcript_81928/g.227150 Transcript_81928/m.227150 type:complete len:565 (+) Transcript_81928:108-1802(+)